MSHRVLKAATALAGHGSPQHHSGSLEAVLRARLDESYALAGDAPSESRTLSLDELRLATATRALLLLTLLQRFLQDEDQSPDAVPLLGTRDTVVVQTLAALTCNWGTNALLASLYSRWPSAMPSASPIVDLTDPAIHLQRLVALTTDLLLLASPSERDVKVKYTRITAEFLTRHLPDVMRAGCTLGWADCLHEKTRVDVQAKTLYILGILPPSRVISSLGSILATPAPTKADDPPPLPSHARKAVSGLLSQQLLRENGVQGLCTAILSDDAEQQDAPWDRLEQISKLLCTVPVGMKASAYFEQMIPRLFALLRHEMDAQDTVQIPPAHKRAAAFTLSRLLALDFRHARISRAIILRTLHLPLLSAGPPSSYTVPAPHEALNLLIAFVSRMDPSPPLFSAVLSPIVPALVTLLEHIGRTRTTAPELRESVRGVLLAWGRVVPQDEATEWLWAVVQGAGAAWEGSAETLRPVVPQADREDAVLPPEVLLAPMEEAHGSEDGLLDGNVFMLRPDPARFVRLLREIGRDDVAAALFVLSLEAYRATQHVPSAHSLTSEDVDPRKPLLYLQLVLQMQSTVPTALETLAKTPNRLLTFVRTALEQHVAAIEVTAASRAREQLGSMTLEDLHIVDDDVEDADGKDSDDDDSDAEGVPTGHGAALAEVALNLLLSLLELHESLLPTDTSGLSELPPLLARLAEDKSNAAVRRSAREATFVLRARVSASSFAGPDSTPSRPLDDAQATYQRALKLVQDPLLPVRASGLALLRSPAVLRERALVPAILDTFLRTVQDEESFVYLNAVQGLVALALSEGKDVVGSLVRAYASGAGTTGMDELDKRLRVGEALGQVVKHLQDALAVHVDAIVPPLFALVRTHMAPVVLRASALGILAQCADSASAAMSPYVTDLCGAMLDLLQTETELGASKPPPTAAPPASQEPGLEASREMLDDDPTSTQSKAPPLRRAAAHFLALLVRTQIVREYAGSGRLALEDDLKRARVVLDYVGATDVDVVVRAMCREVGEMLEQLLRARLGIE